MNIHNESVGWVLEILGLSIDGVIANNIISICNFIFKEFFSKIKPSLKFDVFGKMGKMFSSAGEILCLPF